MELTIYKKLEQVINVTEMSNKWMRWCEQSLPNQSVFVPSVFQMRDAYSHMIRMFAIGIEEQGLIDVASEDCEFDEVTFFKSDIVATQFSSISEHVLRAYFDTADYIVESLYEICKSDNLNTQSDSYLLLRKFLNKYDGEMGELRASKSQMPSDAYHVAERWDSILQIITSAYSFSDREYFIHDLYREVFNTVLNIERNFESDIIKEFDPDFFRKKLELTKLKKMPTEYEQYTDSDGNSVEKIIEDPGKWQHDILDEFDKIENQLQKYLKEYQMLMETIPSTYLIRKVKDNQNQVKSFGLWLISIIISVIVTTCIGQNVFITDQTQATQVNYIFFVKTCLLFIVIELLILVMWYVLRKVGVWLAKKKYQNNRF